MAFFAEIPSAGSVTRVAAAARLQSSGCIGAPIFLIYIKLYRAGAGIMATHAGNGLRYARISVRG
jgi:hypothetical protein